MRHAIAILIVFFVLVTCWYISATRERIPDVPWPVHIAQHCAVTDATEGAVVHVQGMALGNWADWTSLKRTQSRAQSIDQRVVVISTPGREHLVEHLVVTLQEQGFDDVHVHSQWNAERLHHEHALEMLGDTPRPAVIPYYYFNLLEHTWAWKMYLSEKRPLLVLEDDAILTPRFHSAIRSLLQDAPEHYHAIFTGGCLNLHADTAQGDEHALYAVNNTRCASGYLISYEGMRYHLRKFAESRGKHAVNIDHVMKHQFLADSFSEDRYFYLEPPISYESSKIPATKCNDTMLQYAS